MMLLEINAFLGRFHPLIVHLPIGFIIASVLMEWRLKDEKYRKAVSYLWFASAITATVSSLFGWFLANEGSYANWTLFFHRWLGIALIFLSLYAWYIRKGDLTKQVPRKITNILGVAILAVTGHLGGNMTHGSDYLLEYAPKPIQNLMGYGASHNDLPQFDNADSVHVFNDLIYPSLEKKCLSCHNTKVQNGGLDLSSAESLARGGDSGPTVVSGEIQSELLRRVTLPPSSSKFMPTSGTALTYHEVKLLEWWILEGASFVDYIPDLQATESVKSTLFSLYNLDITPRPWIEKTKVASLDSLTLVEMRSTGLQVNQLSQSNGWIEVGLAFGEKIKEEQLESLAKASEQITWLEFKNAGLSDEDLKYLQPLKNLTRVRLQGNNISSLGVATFSNFKHLESLNLNETKIDDSIFNILKNNNSLKNIYVWQTDITPEAITTAKEEGFTGTIVRGAL